jgi:acetyl-CoA C-acetyltransferase
MSELVIVAARRTPFGRFLGKLSSKSAVDLAVIAGDAVLKGAGEAGFDRGVVDQVILGNVLSAGLGMNIARQVALGLNLPVATPAYTVNMMCGSGLKAIQLAATAIRAGEAEVVLCGGCESMSQAPYLAPKARTGLKYGDASFVDTILRDGLLDPTSGQHMGQTVEALARKYAITRAEQDDFAALSQQRATAAIASGRLDAEIVPAGDLARDEHPRADATAAKLAALNPAFDRQGTITAGNASGINDGAALLLLADAERAHREGWPVLARFGTCTSVGCEPEWMGLGPVHALRRLMAYTRTSLDLFDAIEINEAFAAQTLACLRELGLPAERINACGGAIALGHPLAASGARLVVHLAHEIAQGHAQRAVAALCVGGGMGIAATLSTF